MKNHSPDSVELTPLMLNTLPLIKRFARTYNSMKNTVNVELSYLLTATRVVVMVDAKGTWRGGYVVNSSTPLRYLDSFSEATKRTLRRDSGISENDMVEMACIWIISEERRLYEVERLQVYAHAVRDAVATKKTYLIGGSKILQVWKTFELILPKVLYFGFIEFQDSQELGKIVYNDAVDAEMRLRNCLARAT